MARIIKKRSKKVGLPPGTLVHIGERKTEKVRITIIDYDDTHFQQQEVRAIEECFPFKDKPTVTWINIDGIHQVNVIEKIGNHFDLHPLILEDIVNTGQRPKYEDFGHYLFLVLKMLSCEGENCQVEAEQVSVVLGKNFVISFQEREGDVFTPIRERIKNSKGRIRKMRADYLAYTLVDAIIDSYFIILENIGEKIEKGEEALLGNPTPIFASIFIPLTFLAGVYGMNFKYIPELEWPLGYPLVWLLMLIIVSLMLINFKRKKWF